MKSVHAKMEVIKRDGRREPVSFDKIHQRLKLLAQGTYKDGVRFGRELDVDVTPISQQVIMQLKDGITTSKLDEFAADTTAMMTLEHPEYTELAGRIVISNHHKNTRRSFVDTMKDLYTNKDASGKPSPLIDNHTYKAIMDNAVYFDNLVDYRRDYLIDYFGFKTLERSYLLKSESGHIKIQERPQYMYLRVAIGQWGDNLKKVEETYRLLSTKKLSHASPTLFNCGTPHPQNSSCFLLGVPDSLDGIYTQLKKCALISKHAGGLGISVSDVRAKNSKIRGTNGQSDGLIPMLRVFNETARYVNQGGKRKGSIAIYLEPHHADLEDFLDLRKTHGDQSRRALDLFLAMWMSDLFMRRLDQAVKTNDRTVLWSLFCPDEAPGLTDVYGDDYDKLYTQYEREGRYRKQVPILEIWNKITTSQKETGLPYITYKDACNIRSPQKNIGTVKNSNLCNEIVLVNSPQDETISVCNLAAIPLGSFVKVDEQTKVPYFDYVEFAESVRVGIENLNRIIDINFYPVKDCEKSNMRDRPVGLGVAGLYDAFCQMRYPFDSKEARKLNVDIFECMYYHAVKTSMELAKVDGPYQTFPGSPASEGKLQIDLWNEDRVKNGHVPTVYSDKYDWNQLREDVKKYGLRNSTLIALMPTASTAQILGQNESFECMTYNLFSRRVLSGDFMLVNKYLQRDMWDRGLWTTEMQRKLISNRGSVQQIAEVPDDLKALYKTAFEIKQKVQLDLAIERSPFIDQTQSLNIFMSNPDDNQLTTVQLYANKNRLKTGLYYLRREATAKAVAFTATTSTVVTAEKEEEAQICRLNDPTCLACQV
jgi:ribonucleoside-diphosphate reductase alpha chain